MEFGGVLVRSRVERGDGLVQHRAVGVVHRALPANARRTIAFNAFDGGNRAITAKPVREAHAVDGQCKRLFGTSGELAVGMAGDVHRWAEDTSALPSLMRI